MQTSRVIKAARIARDVSPPTHRRFGAMLTGGALVLALGLATALPARAAPDGEDLAKALLGLAIIGAIAESADSKDDRRETVPVWGDRSDHWSDGHHHDKWKKKRRVEVPAVCAVQVSKKRRTTVVFPETCLRRAGLGRDLPRYCADEARIRGDWQRVYTADCLREAGLRIERR